jgi:hypothetical protein
MTYWSAPRCLVPGSKRRQSNVGPKPTTTKARLSHGPTSGVLLLFCLSPRTCAPVHPVWMYTSRSSICCPCPAKLQHEESRQQLIKECNHKAQASTWKASLVLLAPHTGEESLDPVSSQSLSQLPSRNREMKVLHCVSNKSRFTHKDCKLWQKVLFTSGSMTLSKL